MKLKNSNIQTLRLALKNANKNFDNNLDFKRLDDGKTVNFTLRVKSSRGPGAKIGFNGRRTVAACFHAHEALLAELFNLSPGAKVVSAQATFDGIAQFSANAKFVGEKNIGSIMNPLSYKDACQCGS